MPSRRAFLEAASGVAEIVAQPLRQSAAAAKPVRITNINIFPNEIPTPREELEAGKYVRNTFYEIETDAGVRPALLGKDLFAIE